MLFNSIEFMIFFPLVTISYFLLPHRYRWFLLLLASCIFYMAFIPKYLLILAITIIVDYFVGIGLHKTEGSKKKILLVASIACNVGFLFVFKYFNFFNSNLATLASTLNVDYPIKNLSIILPIGLSFHTFQSMSYIIEVYRGNQKPERNFGIYALFVMFYPQLVAGPIERPQNLLNSFHEVKHFDFGRMLNGLQLMVWGLFKKIVIADNLAQLVNVVYNNPGAHHGLIIILATYFFAFQIYCDFSGYTDIARGASRIMGFELMLNFNQPYFSKSISEFWKRWHISLSSWFKDYVYIPLGGNRVPKRRMYFNLMAVFLLSGFWHGANWTFIIWGVLNGLYLIIESLTGKVKERIAGMLGFSSTSMLKNAIQIFITFNLISFAWIFFRAQSLSDAILLIKNIFPLNVTNEFFSGLEANLVIGIMGIAVLLVCEKSNTKFNLIYNIRRCPAVVINTIIIALILCIITFGAYGTGVFEFIYFRF